MKTSLVIVGLGYVGLPLAKVACEAGLGVTGFDISPEVVDSLNAGVSHVDDLTDNDIVNMLNCGFTATLEPRIFEGADVVVICVPTPLSEGGGPDLSAVIGAVTTISEHLHKGMLVVLESTTYPGTTDEVVRPVLEARGLRAGKDFHLAFSPERIDPGNPVYGAKNTPKVVGGITTACTDRAAAFYEEFIDRTVRTRGTREAEMAKLLENTYRHVNIALVNEMARFCHDLGIDLWDAIRAASSKPFGFEAFYPGPGVGGHCIPIDPNYLSHNVQARLGYPFRFVELAQEINTRMPSYVVERSQDLLNENRKPIRGSVVLLLGVTYKANIADQRETPATGIAQKLIAKGAVLRYHDPHVASWRAVPEAEKAQDVNLAVGEADLTILLQNHSAYEVDDLARRAKIFFDTRGATSNSDGHVSML